jgi:hypothetical protein
MENLCHDGERLGRDLNPGPSEYEARFLATRPRLSIKERKNYVHLILVVCKVFRNMDLKGSSMSQTT